MKQAGVCWKAGATHPGTCCIMQPRQQLVTALPYLTASCAVPCRPHSGALRGASAPLSIPALVKELGIEGLASLQALVPSLVEELAAEGERQGACAAREGRMCLPALSYWCV